MIFAKYSEKSLEFFLGFTINNNVHNKTQQRKYSDSNYQFFFFFSNATYFFSDRWCDGVALRPS